LKWKYTKHLQQNNDQNLALLKWGRNNDVTLCAVVGTSYAGSSEMALGDTEVDGDTRQPSAICALSTHIHWYL